MFLLFHFNAGRTILRVRQASLVSSRPFPCQAGGNWDGKADLEFVSLFFDCLCSQMKTYLCFCYFTLTQGGQFSVSSRPLPCHAGLFRVKQAEIRTVSLISNS